MKTIKFRLLNEHATLPQFGTTKAACFDIKACFENYPHQNTLKLNPGQTVLCPTGLAVDLPAGTSLRLYSRSGNALKKGLVLANGVGVIDEDYIDEIGVILHNTSNDIIIVHHGDRIAQGEVVELSDYRDIQETTEELSHKSDRVGGFGSTDKPKTPKEPKQLTNEELNSGWVQGYANTDSMAGWRD